MRSNKPYIQPRLGLHGSVDCQLSSACIVVCNAALPHGHLGGDANLIECFFSAAAAAQSVNRLCKVLFENLHGACFLMDWMLHHSVPITRLAKSFVRIISWETVYLSELLRGCAPASN